MPNPWIDFIKKYAKDNNLSYLCAMCEVSKDPNKKGYKKKVKQTDNSNDDMLLLNTVINFVNSFRKAVKNNDEQHIINAKDNFKKRSNKFKKELEKFPDVFNALNNDNNDNKNELNKLKSQLDYIKDTYIYDYEKIADAVDNGVTINKNIKKNLENLHKKFTKLLEIYKEKGGKYKGIKSPQELGL